MKKKIIISAVVLLVIAGIVVGFTVLRNNKNNGIRYKQEALTRGDIEAVVTTSGTLNPVTVVDVGSQVSGRISKLYADFNSRVKQGQIVAELDQSILESRVEQNKANYQSSIASLERARVTLDNLKKKYDRALNLFEKNLISYEEKEAAEAAYLEAKTDVQSQEARVEQAKSQYESSKVDLAYAIIRSPIDGIVISRSINLGQTVAASFQAPVLFKIANDLSKMQVECSVDEADIGKVKEGQKVRFTVDAFPDDTFYGAVKQVRYSPEVVQNVVTYTTIVEVKNPELKLRPGMTATVTVITGEAKNALKVPNAALRFTPDLTPEQMQEMYKGMQQRFAERRQASGSRQEGSAQPQRGSQMNPGGSRMKQPSRVWVVDKDRKLSMVFIKPGVTDNTFTEVAWGDLKEGQLVITGLESGTGQSSSSSAQRPRRMMFDAH
jgi:HlyD family secretion protein